MTALKMPSIAAVAASLRRVKRCIDDECDVRLQVYEGGEWAVRYGDSSYDQDHRGYWGASSIDPRSNCRDVARDLIDQAADHAAQ